MAALKPLKIDVVSDVVCPWCYIGKRRFEAALARFEHADDVEVVWKSFELDPNAPVHRGSTADHLARKYGMTLEQVARSHERMTGLAAAEGLEYHLDETQGGNTFEAHRLLQLAKERGLGGEMKERLMRAYHTEGEPIGDRETLRAGQRKAERRFDRAGQGAGTDDRPTLLSMATGAHQRHR